MASTRTIRLTPAYSTLTNTTVDGIRIQITADSAVDMPNEVFAYRLIPLQPDGTAQQAVFSHVCSPVDLEEFPVGAPLVNAQPPWFRLATVDLVFRGRQTADDGYDAIVADVGNLVASLDALDQLEALTPFYVGAQPGP
jgi:hypothetical protein